MALDTRYIPLNYLQQYFVNKDDGTPLSGGKVYFFRDQARTIPKPVYELSGNPPDYTYSVLDSVNGLALSSVGTFIDQNGSDISVYLFPYDDNNNVDLYYISIYDSHGGLQETREAVPNLGGTSGNKDVFTKNYIINGQFLLHNNIDTTPLAGLISEAEIPIAPGGWYFRRSAGSTAVDYVTFNSYGSVLEKPSGFPQFYCRVKCTVPNLGDAYKAIGFRWYDVNSFASDTQYYTFSFNGVSNSGGSVPVAITLIKNFGSGGSPTQAITIKPSILINSSNSLINVPFIFGDNAGSTIGANSYVAIEVWFPTGYLCDVSVTNFALVEGNVTLTGYPFTPQYDTVSKSLAGLLPVPDYDGANLGLPIINTKTGLIYNDSIVGTFIWSMSATQKGAVYCNGISLPTNGFSPEGIPYRRLWEKWKNSEGMAMFGTGYLAYAAKIGLVTPNILSIYLKVIYYHEGGNVIDGSIPTGFTFTDQPIVDYKGYICNITNIKAASNITPGAYFLGRSSGLTFVFWFSIDGNGSAPLISSSNSINIQLQSTHTAADVQWLIMYYINAAYVAPPDLRGYFPRFADTVNGNRIDPDTEGVLISFEIVNQGINYKVGDVVKILHGGGDSDGYIEISNINGIGGVTNGFFLSYGYHYPTGTFTYNCTGGSGSGLTLSAKAGGYRNERPDGVNGANVGTTQESQVISHRHIADGAYPKGLEYLAGNSHIDGTQAASYYEQETMSAYGGNETRPINIAFNMFVLI